MRRLTRVKYDGEQVTICYERDRASGEPDKVSIECGDAPDPGFTDALQALAIHVAELCEFDKPQVVRSQLTVRGVSFSWSNEIMGATITALKLLKRSAAPLVLNTPHKPSEPTSEQMPEEQCLPPACRKALHQLECAAWDYVDGLREQTDLFAGAVQPAGVA